jgi:hypothetical protein
MYIEGMRRSEKRAETRRGLFCGVIRHGLYFRRNFHPLHPERVSTPPLRPFSAVSHSPYLSLSPVLFVRSSSLSSPSPSHSLSSSYSSLHPNSYYFTLVLGAATYLVTADSRRGAFSSHEIKCSYSRLIL